MHYKLTFIAFLLILNNLFAQTDDLMIIEYVDMLGNDGWALRVHNPTDQILDLTEYKITRYKNGATNSTNTEPALIGSLNPGESKIFGNTKYKNACSSNTIELSTGFDGTNERDVLSIKKIDTDEFVDMVGAFGVETDITVNGQTGNGGDALFQNILTRNTDNCIRYFDEAGTSIHSWPDNENTNVTTWDIASPGCLSNSDFDFQIPNFDLGVDTTLCDTLELTLNYTSLGFQSYEWVGQNNNTPIITIADSGSFILKVENENFCGAQDEIIVSFESCDTTIIPEPEPEPVDTIPEDSIITLISADSFLIPNIITPNGDKMNDEFAISGVDSNIVVLNIYNRWGKKVYEEINYKNQWKAEGLNDGTYFYKILIDNINEYKGYVEVKR